MAKFLLPLFSFCLCAAQAPPAQDEMAVYLASKTADAERWLTVGQVLVEASQTGLAMTALRTASQLDPLLPGPHLLMGSLCDQDGLKAQQHFAEAAARAVHSHVVETAVSARRYGLAERLRSSGNLGRKLLVEAASIEPRVLGKQENVQNVVAMLAESCRSRLCPDELSAYILSGAAAMSSAMAWQELGEVLVPLNPTLAHEALRIATRLAPGMSAPHEGMGKIAELHFEDLDTAAGHYMLACVRVVVESLAVLYRTEGSGLPWLHGLVSHAATKLDRRLFMRHAELGSAIMQLMASVKLLHYAFDTVARGETYATGFLFSSSSVNEQQRQEQRQQSPPTVTTYHSSEWEQLWVANIGKWQDERSICEAMLNQTDYLGAFMTDLCSAATDTPWCLIDDSVNRFWFHTLDGRVHGSYIHDELHAPSRPPEITRVYEIEPVTPSDPRVWSRFEKTNLETGETEVEYIEPLVGHLRHPLALCGRYGRHFLLDRSYILPGLKAQREKKKKPAALSYLYDAGASSWASGEGGPSLIYFAEYWRRFGFDWTLIEAFEGNTLPHTFRETVPLEWQTRVKYHHANVTVAPSSWPFIPSVIQGNRSLDDYVVFKLDIDSGRVETAIVDYLLQWDHLHLIDEFLWEHHVSNFLMAPYWTDTQDTQRSIADSYQYFLRLRQRGLRAHSWV